MELQGNKYNAKTETQLKFAERYENDSIFDRQPIAWCELLKFTEE